MAKKPRVFETPFETYTAVSTIGEGGSGQVFEVVDSSGACFALKCLSSHRVNAERLKRFKNEITFCQRLQHVNVVQVLDTGVTDIDGIKCPFYVMKRYPGTLRTLIQRIPTSDALEVFAQIIDGVEAAHLSNVWHRDLKPENILWSEKENGFVVADFGIAHFEEEELYTAVETKAVARLANFQYAAPEQKTRGAKVDRRADIFSLGLMLNELFTKQVPHGVGFIKIADVDTEFSYVDEIVEAMLQQSPDNRHSTIESIKKELIGRKNAFVALQKYDTERKRVVKSSNPPEFEPIVILSLDFINGVLKFKLIRAVPPGWIQEFQYPRGGHSGISGYGPERFQIAGDTLSIGVHGSESQIQDLVNYVKNYVSAANRGYVLQMQENAAEYERQQRLELEKRVAEAELRKNILERVKL